eukprot:gene15861-18847_t
MDTKTTATAAAAVKLDSKSFHRRIRTIYNSWENAENEPFWKGADALVLALGMTDDNNPYQKVTCMQSWMFGYEMRETVFVFLKKSIHIVASQKKIQIFESIEKPTEGEAIPLHFHMVNKADNNKANFEALISEIKKSNGGKNVGVIIKEKFFGEFGKAWEEVLNSQCGEEGPLVKVDITPEKISSKLTKEFVDYAYEPIVQSGGIYDLRLNASSNDDNLHFGTIIVSLGTRYKNYCTNIARTYFIDPSEEIKTNYALLLNVQQTLIKLLKPGTKFSAVYEKVVQSIEESKPGMSKYFLKSCGFGIGLEFQEFFLAINATNNKTIRGGMVFNIIVGFQNVEAEKFKDDKSKVYSMLISDTVSVDDDGKVTVLTQESGKKTTDVFYFISDQATPADSFMDGTVKRDPSLALEMTEDLIAITGKKRETKQKSAEDKRRDHQNMLAQRNLEETENKIRAMEKRGGEQEVKEVHEDYSSITNKLNLYSNTAAYPSDVVKNKISVDSRKEAILLPIYGYIVPFHISTIKNVSKYDDFLRINFNTPTSLSPEQTVGIPKQLLYVREVTYRIQEAKALSNTLRLIKEMRKRVTTRETENRFKMTLIAQEKLILTRGRFPRLNDVSVRPTISGRRSLGNLEAHENGLRFNPTGIKDKAPIDILYKNIKHALFQQAEQESIVLVHFHLHDALMIGKKKTKDVQFYSEISEMSQSLDVTSRSMNDELEEEARERDIKRKLNAEYQNFVKRVEEIVPGGLEFDIPYRDLAFYGVPHLVTVLLQPSVQCLVNLLEMPFYVLSLDEVEIACFERVSRSLRSFDLVFVFKDYTRIPNRIDAIPREYFETIKDWLDSCNIKFYNSERNLVWKKIMESIRVDLKGWKEDGGWSFLDPEEGSSEEDDDDEDYVPSEAEDEDSSDYQVFIVKAI